MGSTDGDGPTSIGVDTTRFKIVAYAASTFFMVDPLERLTAMLFTQLLPSSTHPLRSQLRQLVHAGDDLSLTEGLEALPYVFKSTQAFAGGKPYRLFPTTIAMRANPYGASPAENPGNGIEGKATGSFGFIRNTNWLYSSDYFRVRSLTLGYDLGLIVNKKLAQGARVYVTAENWFGHDKYYGGLNPDAINTNNGSTFVSGSDYGGLPLAKSLILGLNLTF